MWSPRITILLVFLALLGTDGCKQKSPEERGREETVKKAGYLKGVGEGLKNEGEVAAQALGEGLGKVVKGASGGVMGGFNTFAVEIAPAAAAKGLKLSRVQVLRRDDKPEADKAPAKSVTAYLMSDQNYAGSLRLVALDSAKKEVGRSTITVTIANGEAKYVDFSFDTRTPLEEVKSVVLQTP
jgi:hypothetical protein